MPSTTARLAIAATAFFLSVAGGVQAAELTLLAPQAMKPALGELIPQFERSSGNKVAVVYAAGSIHIKNIQDEQAADVVILSSDWIEELQDDKKIVQDSVTPIAKAELGLIIHKGAPKPDVGTVRALRHTLLDAKAIALGDPENSISGEYFADLLERLQIADAVKPKVKTFVSAPEALQAVADGEADIAVGVVSTANGPATELAGVLPAQAKKINAYSAAILTGSAQAQAAKELIAFVASSASLTVLKSKGFAPP